MGKTIVGLYDGPFTGERVVSELSSAGFDNKEVRIVTTADFQERPALKTDVLGISGMAKPELGKFEEAVRRGGSVVAVTAEDAKAKDAETIMEQHRPLDLEELAAQWKIAGWKNPYEAVKDQRTASRLEGTNTQVGRDRAKMGVRVFVW